SGEPRWLGVLAQIPGEPEQPRVLLVSVPYALKAADADTIGGKPASAFVLAQNYLPTEGTLPLGADPRNIAPRISGTGSANKVTKWQDSIGTVEDSSIQDNGTGTALTIDSSNRIGIGTTTPGVSLDISGSNPLVRVTDNSTTGISGLVFGNQ